MVINGIFKMSLKERICQKIFKCNLSASVEYHAGGFFVRKRAGYLIFDKKNKALFFEKDEGLHPNDNKYDLLIKELSHQPDVLLYEVASLSDNIVVLSNNDKQMKIMPSVFIESIVEETLTEIIVDNIDRNVRVFNFVYAIEENSEL